MKKIFCILITLAALFSLTACSSQTSDTVTFQAAILEIHDNYYLVEPVEGSAELNSGDQITVSMTNMNASTEPEVGDILEIVYDGWISESYPGQITNVYSISVVELSPLDGVTMEVTECSDTSVTVRIVNDTDKDIQCGEDFCLKMQDEETGEWRELDKVIDNAAFNTIAYMIQKDFPYEKVIDFEWLYGRLEPGRYRIVKTITDFRGTGDYTDYTYTAEFSI